MRMREQETYKRGAVIFVLVLFLAIVSRLDLAMRVKPCLDGDESMTGVMSYRIQDRGEHPVYPYGHEYGGGVSVEAHAAAALNAAFGRSVLNVQLPAAIAFSVLAAAGALLAFQAAGTSAAVFTGMHLIFSPQLYRSSIQAYGYMEALAAMAVCFWIILFCIRKESESGLSKRVVSGAMMGLLSGFAFWCVEFSVVMTAFLFLLYAARVKRGAVPFLAAWAVSFPVGAAPAVYFNFSHGFRNLRHLIGGHGVGGHRAHAPVYEFFSRELPSFFQSDNTDYFTQTIPAAAWLLSGVTAIGCAVALYYAVQRGNGRRPGRDIIVFGLLFCAVYSAVYIVSPFRGESARYLLPLEPYITIAAAAGLTAAARSGKAVAVLSAAVILGMFVFADAKGTAFAFSDDTVSDGYGRVSCSEGDDLVRALDENGVTHVFTSRFVKWMLLYRTGERIKAADVNLVPSALAWTEYEEAVAAAPDAVFVFNRRDNHIQWLMLYLRAKGIPFGMADTGVYVIIRPAARVSQIDFMKWSKETYAANAPVGEAAVER